MLETLKEREDFWNRKDSDPGRGSKYGRRRKLLSDAGSKGRMVFSGRMGTADGSRKKDCAHGMKGTHGYLPGEADYQTFLQCRAAV